MDNLTESKVRLDRRGRIIPPHRKLLAYFSSLEFFFWAAMATNSFVVVYLSAKGMSNVGIGIVLALNNLMTIVGQPIWGVVSDKMGSTRKVLIICVAGASLMSVILPLAYGDIPMTTVMAVMTFFRMPLTALVDSWVIQTTNESQAQGMRLNYGSIRLWGSIGFAAASFSYYWLINQGGAPYETAFYGFVFFGAVMIVLCLMLKSDKKKASVPLKNLHIGRLFKDYYFITFMLFYMCISMPVNFGASFLPKLVEAVGAHSEEIGMVVAVKALMEVPMLFLSAKLAKRFSLIKIIFTVAALYMIEQFLYFFAQNVFQIILVQCLHGMAFGLYLSCTVSYIFSIVPRELNATGQTLCAAASGVSAMIGSSVSGWIIDLWGIRMLYVFGGVVQLVAVVFFLLSFPIGKMLGLQHPNPATLRRAGEL